MPTYAVKSTLMWPAIWSEHEIFFLHPWKPSLCRRKHPMLLLKDEALLDICEKKKKKKRLLPLDTCCKHSTRSRCRGTGWPKAGRKWSSRKSSSGPLATQLTNPQLLRYNCRSCTGQQLSSWAVSLVKPIQRWKVNAHTRGFAGATPPARQLFSACLFVQIQILFGKNSKGVGLT